jgi:predicted transcriptional regulator of viral defense system
VDTIAIMSPNTTELPPACTYAAARDAGLSDRALASLVADGTLERLGRGVYRKATAPLADHDLIEVALRAPDATLCLLSALAHHDLTDAIPATIDVALPRSRRAPKVQAPVTWHRFHEGTFEIGRQTIDLDEGVPIGVYAPERCIIDAFRLRHEIGDDVAIEALKRWLRRPGAVPAELLRLARAFPKAEPSVLRALQVLL